MGYGYNCAGCCGASYYYSACCGGCCGGVAYAPAVRYIDAGPPVKVTEKDPSAPPMKKTDEAKGGKTIEDEDSKKATTLSADEMKWLVEMLEAEKDAAKKKEIEEEFKGESHLGRAAMYKLYKKDKAGGEAKAARVIVHAAKDVSVTVNGVRVARQGYSDTFTTPNLPHGKSFSYTVTATVTRGGREVTETKRVGVTAGARAEVAEVTVVAPKNTPVRVNGSAYTISGKKTFETPSLKTGQSYFYTVEADVERGGKKVTETRRVSVAAGKAVTVDFTERTVVAGR
jgi:uncharacterized protein (TIGR03000 family)